MSNSVTIRVPARLHLGFLDPSGGSGRRFGSLGLPLCEPETVVTLSRSGETVVTGPESDRAAAHLTTMARRLGIRALHRLVVEEAIPRHAGLGSGTQIALAVAAALLLVYMLFCLRGFRIALLAQDGFSKLLAVGLTFGFALQTFIIVGGVLRLVPLTGITLPFVSYGGTSIVANFAMVALLLLVSNRAVVTAR